jgi:hypothetical protein
MKWKTKWGWRGTLWIIKDFSFVNEWFPFPATYENYIQLKVK